MAIPLAATGIAGACAEPLSPIAAVEYLEATCPLARNHDLGVALAELNLPNVTAGVVDLLGDHGALLTHTKAHG